MTTPEVRSANALVVRTRRRFASDPSKVWPLLCDSKMVGPTTPLFLLGVPQPLECRLPNGSGGVGAERECISDQGVVRQRILEWSPEKRLSFRMERMDLPMQGSVQSMIDTIELVPSNPGLEVTRTTTISVHGHFQWLKKLLLFVGVRQVHRYVFRNWVRLAA